MSFKARQFALQQLCISRLASSRSGSRTTAGDWFKQTHHCRVPGNARCYSFRLQGRRGGRLLRYLGSGGNPPRSAAILANSFLLLRRLAASPIMSSVREEVSSAATTMRRRRGAASVERRYFIPASVEAPPSTSASASL